MDEGRRTSSGSLLLVAPTIQRVPRKQWPPKDEIIPDSEEERLNEGVDEDSDVQVVSMSPTRVSERSVIVVSSGSEEDEGVQNARGLTEGTEDPIFAESVSTIPRRRNKEKVKGHRSLPRVESDSESSVICISDAESDTSPPHPPISPIKQRILQRTLTPYTAIPDSNNTAVASDDSAILTFDPPARTKPVLRNPDATYKSLSSPKVPARGTASTSATPRKPRAVPPEQLRLEAYARTLFAELNTVVFEGGMPSTTELVWNVRLATTAGRAFWSRNRNGETSSKIELSPKVVDSDERVRYTLAHEMCHLAVWVLDGNPNEQGHGRQFKTWAARVMEARPDIIISTKHTYEINYKYYWECCACGWKYGRHSKSIDPDKKSCGACDPPGRLKALFNTGPPRTPKAASKSKLASGSPRQSPRATDRAPRETARHTTSASTEEDEVEELIKGLKNTDI